MQARLISRRGRTNKRRLSYQSFKEFYTAGARIVDGYAVQRSMLDSEGGAVTMRGRCRCLGMAIDSCSAANNVINWECTVEKMKRGDHGYSTLAC